MPDTWIIGDVHGEYVSLCRILLDAGLLDTDLHWAGQDAHLWCTGDFVDRGPDGIAVLDLVIRLQQEAAASGGQLNAVLGNHDLLLVAAKRFGERPSSGPGGSFIEEWRINGGMSSDLTGLTTAHEAWLTGLPAMALVRDRLLVHADASLYLRYGDSLERVNASVAHLIATADERAWDRLLGHFAGRLAFHHPQPEGTARARQLLETCGGRQIVHGHTPIALMVQRPPEDIATPYVYAGGLCVNVDGGLYLGGAGFAWRIPDE
jgi:hypothetical protein